MVHKYKIEERLRRRGLIVWGVSEAKTFINYDGEEITNWFAVCLWNGVSEQFAKHADTFNEYEVVDYSHNRAYDGFDPDRTYSSEPKITLCIALNSA